MVVGGVGALVGATWVDMTREDRDLGGMKTSNRICDLLGIEVPIIQAGMVWCSGWELASAVSAAGGLGILGAGSMYPEVLRDQIQKLQAAAPGKPIAVNVPLLYPAVEEHMKSIVELHKIYF